MKNRQLLLVAVFAILFLFLIQAAGVLVEAIYILDLMNSTLDAKVAGVLFFFSPLLLLFLRRRSEEKLAWGALGVLLLARGLMPYLETSGRLVAAGLAAAAALLLLPIWLTTYLKDSHPADRLLPAQGLALAAGLSTLLRTLNATLDLSLESGGAWLGWVLGLLLLLLVTRLSVPPALSPDPPAARPHGLLGSGIGLGVTLALAHFAFFSPGVIARWTEGSYPLIISLVSALALAWVFLGFWRPGWFGRISVLALLAWNLLFAAAITGLILSHTPAFPAAPESAPVVVGAPNLVQQLLLLAVLLLFPVIFVNFSVFTGALLAARPRPAQVAPGLLLGVLGWVLLIFMVIFTNVWGYVEPVSPFFRGKFWLPFLLASGLPSLFALGLPVRFEGGEEEPRPVLLWTGVLLSGMFVLTSAAALLTEHPLVMGDKDALVVMTYNIQQANDVVGEKSYQAQLALIRQVDPDILALQESDSARISLGNNDYVRYYASHLGYYAYYGPRTVTGTYGTALLSKYPLENPHTIFSYSDQDEVGTSVAEIVVSGRRFTIFDVHPDGSDLADQAFASALLEQAAGAENVIALGDFNLRDWEAAYQRIDAVYQNAWMTVYPTGINSAGLDMTGKIRIDHIFVSPHLIVQDAFYRLPPESATDHPVHWAWITWK